MSKNIAIKEGDTIKTFSSVKKIRIKNMDGGSDFWIPESETTLGTKHISENGTYKASEEVDEQGHNKNWYGYSEVTVSGVGKATGVGEDGNEHLVEPDDDNNLVDKTIPSFIKIVQTLPPWKDQYVDGEKINIAGAVIQGFTKKNEPWEGDEEHPNGVIPYAEITLVPDTAEFSGQGDIFVDDQGIKALAIECTEYSNKQYIGGYHSSFPLGITGEEPHLAYWFLVRSNNDSDNKVFYTRWGDEVYGITPNSNSHLYVSYKSDGSTGSGTNPSWAPNGSVFGAHTSANSGYFNQIIDDIPYSDVDPTNLNFENRQRYGVYQKIKVKWNRVGDGKELETEFVIFVIRRSESNGNQEGEEGSEGGGGHNF